eukprot:13053482-Alexandrium_andersonii.AAC.1
MGRQQVHLGTLSEGVVELTGAAIAATVDEEASEVDVPCEAVASAPAASAPAPPTEVCASPAVGAPPEASAAEMDPAAKIHLSHHA